MANISFYDSQNAAIAVEKRRNINLGLLLVTPTEHNRFDFYPREERKEN
ncbi:hypothetical protein [Arcticibacterium luteifluviistationis]|nr:hypothetical protein [Arcticibacterium luteifluviistationis]